MEKSSRISDVFVTYTSFGSIFAFVFVALLCLVGYQENYFNNFYYDKLVHTFAGVTLAFLSPLLLTVFALTSYFFNPKMGRVKLFDFGEFLYPEIETVRLSSFLIVLFVSTFWEFVESLYPNLLMKFLPIPYVRSDSGVEMTFDILFGMLGWCGVNKVFFEKK